MHVEMRGPETAPPLLLLHGGGVGGWMWGPVRARLRAPWRMMVPDLPGHDRSAGSPYTSHEAVIAELVALLERTGKPAVAAGFSLGAQLAVLLASERPDLVERVVAVSAQAVPAPATGPTLALLSATAGLARNPAFARAQARELFVPDALLPDYLRTSAAMSRATLVAAVGANLRFRIPAGWSRFPGSARILVGERERRLMHRSAAALHDALPSAVREEVPGCGHGIPLQRPDLLARILDESD
ncbi:alpha/beta fold hydrolase [Microbacterium resistens]|uniref:alpha/beta fold hydrolase n=1 Tax=Microbacterium resistens TaxID=156977 RepID=UPI000A3E3BA4|nr:alpha/beta hydrolase [Microbacterium resistens]